MIAVQLANLGLFTFTNLVGQAPPGSMTVAQNIVIDKPGVAETRRGFQQFGTMLFADTIYKLFSFQNRLIVHHGTTLTYDSSGTGTPTNYGGSFSPPTGDKIRGTEANSNFYFTTNNGIYKIDSLTNNPYQAGGIAALDVNVALAGAGSGFLAASSQCAYRITWVYVDANNNEIEGNPSEAVTLTNNGGTADNSVVKFTVPSSVTTAYFYRIYRTPQTNSLSIPPSDTFQLAFQLQVTSGQISSLQVSVTDITPDTLLGQLLYTSPGAEGEFQTNDAPPLAYDICTFQGMTFYFNCSTIQQFYITIISVGPPNGLQIGDQILLGSPISIYTGNATNVYASNLYAIVTTGTIAQNIDATARNLVGAINQDPTNTSFYAYYVSGFNQLPGQILIRARNLSHGAFSILSTRGGAFSPVIPSSGATYVSSNNTVLNGLYVSKLNQPEAVPLENLLFIGSSDQQGYRVYPLRDAVIAQSKGGVFRITGSSPSNLTVSPFDNTVIQYGNDTGVTLNNSVYSYTTQGEISVTESGSQIMSRNVEGDLLTLSAQNVFSNFTSLAFGVSYESDRKYILCLGASPSDTVSTSQYVYNWITQSYTLWNLSVTCGLVNPFDNLLYFGGSDGQVLQERKNYNITDYADRQWSVSVIGSSGNTVSLNSTANAVIGYTLAQGISGGQVARSAVITAVNTLSNVVTVDMLFPWVIGPAIIAQPINQTLTYAPLTCGYPNFIKKFQPVISFVFGDAYFTQATVGFSTDFYVAQETVTLLPKYGGGWGTFPWGTLPWGVSTAYLQGIPTFLTKNTFMAHWLNISVSMNRAFEKMELSGIYIFYDIFGERSR